LELAYISKVKEKEVSRNQNQHLFRTVYTTRKQVEILSSSVRSQAHLTDVFWWVLCSLQAMSN